MNKALQLNIQLSLSCWREGILKTLDDLRDSSATADLSIILVHSKFCSYWRIDVAPGITLLSRISSLIPYRNNIVIMRSMECRFEENSRRSCVHRNVDLERTGPPSFKLLHNFPIIYTSLCFIILWFLPQKTTISESFHHFMAVDFLMWGVLFIDCYVVILFWASSNKLQGT